MRTLQTTDIVSPVKAPITARTLNHINAMVKEPSDEIVKALIGTYTTNDIIILRGCEVTAVIPGTSSITAGAAYYNGNVYSVDANASISTSGGQTLVWVVDEDADQAQFSDGNSYDFHITSKLKLQAGASGSGLANYNATTIKYYKEVTDNSASNSAFALSLVTTGCTASISFSRYTLMKVGNKIDFSYRITVSVSAVGGGNNFFNFKITPKTAFKSIVSQGLLVSQFNPNAYDVDGTGYFASDSSGDLESQYDNTFVATVTTYSFIVFGSYFTA